MYSAKSDLIDGDRFIPKRRTKNLETIHFQLVNVTNTQNDREQCILNQKPTCLHQHSYIKLLQSVINFNDYRILSFHKFNNDNMRKAISFKSCRQWPSYPRKKPLIGKSDLNFVLDLPDFDADLGANLMDWSASGYIATIFNDTVYLWHNSSVDEIIKTTIKANYSLRWNHAGTYLAVAYKNSFMVTAMFQKENYKYDQVCSCLLLCHVTALIWKKNDKYILTGCTRGIIRKWQYPSDDGRLFFEKDYVSAHIGSVLRLQLSKNDYYICSTGDDCNVRIWTWKNLDDVFNIKYPSIVRAISFHPWQESLLAVGGGIGDGSISLYNISNKSQMDFMCPEQESFVDCLTWSPVTGELVSSHHILCRKTLTFSNKILVLSSLNHVVDTIENHTGRVLCMMWNGNGTQLATAGTDENLCIWNFMGYNYQQFYKNALSYRMPTSRKKPKSVLSNSERFIR